MHLSMCPSVKKFLKKQLKKLINKKCGQKRKKKLLFLFDFVFYVSVCGI